MGFGLPLLAARRVPRQTQRLQLTADHASKGIQDFYQEGNKCVRVQCKRNEQSQVVSLNSLGLHYTKQVRPRWRGNTQGNAGCCLLNSNKALPAMFWRGDLTRSLKSCLQNLWWRYRSDRGGQLMDTYTTRNHAAFRPRSYNHLPPHPLAGSCLNVAFCRLRDTL